MTPRCWGDRGENRGVCGWCGARRGPRGWGRGRRRGGVGGRRPWLRTWQEACNQRCRASWAKTALRVALVSVRTVRAVTQSSHLGTLPGRRAWSAVGGLIDGRPWEGARKGPSLRPFLLDLLQRGSRDL